MPAVRAHVLMPKDLLVEIDSLVGRRRRSQFLAEAARQEVKRRQLLSALQEAAGCWKDEHHPELRKGPKAWLRRLRKQDDRRLGRFPKNR